MRKNSIFTAALLLMFSGCVSVLSQVSDEEAWNDYYKDLKVEQQHEDRTLASASPLGDAEPRAGIKILRQILAGMPFRNFLLSCDQRDCFQSQLVLAFDQAFRRLKEQNIVLTVEEYASEQKHFLNSYAYEKVLSWVESFHRMLLSGVELRTAQRAVDLAHLCEGTLSSETETSLNHFSPYLGGITYLPRPYYSCLNDHWQGELDELLKETTDRLGITIKTPEAKNWIIQHQVSPIYHKTLNDIFTQQKQDEMALWAQSWPSLEKRIDWKKSIEELIRAEVPALRKQYHFINLEAILTEFKNKSQAVSAKTR